MITVKSPLKICQTQNYFTLMISGDSMSKNKDVNSNQNKNQLKTGTCLLNLKTHRHRNLVKSNLFKLNINNRSF